MNQIDATVGIAGALAVSVAVSVTVYAALRRVQRPAAPPPPQRRARLGTLEVAALGLLDEAPEPAPALHPVIRARRVTLEGRTRTPRPGAAPAPAARCEPGAAELLSLIGTMQWDRALAVIEDLAARGGPPGSVAVQAEAAALERVRALPDSDGRVGFGAYRVLAALAPGNPAYAEKVAQGLAALESRRAALLADLTRDEDRFEPGTVWFNHPWNPRFDDVRRPIWLYVGYRSDGRPCLRLRTNWLGDFRIAARGLLVVHDGMTETLTQGAYKIDADALGWEWRDEPADMYQLEVLRSLVGAGEVTLRYKGDPWPCEAPLPDEEKRALGEMIELYDLMTLAAPSPCEAQAA